MSTLTKRTLSTLILLATLCGAVFLPYKMRIVCFLILCLFLGFGMTWEFCKIINRENRYNIINLITSISVSAIVVFDVIFKGETTTHVILTEMIISSLLFWIAILFLCKKQDYMLAVLKAFTVFAAFSVSIKVIVFIYFYDSDSSSIPATFLFFVLATKSGDIGAYLFGTLCNTITKGKNHKLVPSVSPGKSWEGLIGGLAFSLTVCFCVLVIFPDNRIGVTSNDVFKTIIVGTLLFFGGMLGDLSESSIKRTFDVKDSGKCLPGIGGLYDLTDSLIVDSLVFFLILRVINS